jgi:DNA polymerase V
LNKPVAVLSSNDGCIVARSQEVKDMGVPMGVPYFKIKDFTEDRQITLFSSNFNLYRDVSQRVMSALKEEFEECEIYSVDEAFFDVPRDLKQKSAQVARERIIQKTGIPVSVGVGESKTLAKVANNIAKKSSGVCFVDSKNRKETIESIPCGSVWGIGRQISTKLHKKKVTTVGDFLSLSIQQIRDMLGVHGERMYLELSGVSVYKVGEERGTSQENYTSSRSFGSTTHDKEVLKSALQHHVARLAKKLREAGVETSRVSVLMRGSRHGLYAHRPGVAQSILPIPSNDTFVLSRELDGLLELLYDSEIPYKKAGVTLGGIRPSDIRQETLFGQGKSKNKTSVVSKLMDTINRKKGPETLKFGTSLNGSWREKKELKSQEYTTKWSEIPLVKAT